MIDEEQLAEWERLANEATDGPWFVDDRVVGREMWVVTGDVENEVPPIAVVTNKPDKFFIAAAREAVPALIAEIRELRAELAKEREYADDNCMIGMFHGTSMAHDRIRQLEKEADWLAFRLTQEAGIEYLNWTADTWRVAAHEAVQND